MPILLFFAFLLCIGILTYLAWRLTKSWPIVFRLILTTLPIAFILTPSVVGGENFAFIAPLVLVLIDGRCYSSLGEFFSWVLEPLGFVWGILFFIASVVAAIRYALSKRGSTRR